MQILLKLSKEDQNFLKRVQKKYNISLPCICVKLLSFFIDEVQAWKTRGEIIKILKKKIHSHAETFYFNEYEKFYEDMKILEKFSCQNCKCVPINVDLDLDHFQQKFLEYYISKKISFSRTEAITFLFTNLIKQEIWKNNFSIVI